jgi:hypothetical protein
MRSIWYFVGLVLLEMGGLVFVAGIIDYATQTAASTALAHTYPGIWWGGIMIATGVLFYGTHRNKRHG